MEGDAFEFPPEMFGRVPLFAEIAKAMSWSGGPINWDMARQIATAMASSDSSPPVIDSDVQELREAVRLAEAWLAEAAGFPFEDASTNVRIVTPAGWVEAALGRYPELLDPLGGKIAGALSADAGGEADQMTAVIRQIIPLFLGIQCGSVLGALSKTVLTSADVPLPVEEERTVMIVAGHVDAHAHEFSIDRLQMRYWTALHATARRLLYDAFPWTRAHFWSLYHAYLAAIDVNLAETIERLQALDITSPDQMQSAIGQNLFGLGGVETPGPALERVQTFLALIEAASNRALKAAAGGRLVSLGVIEESLSRRSSAAASGERALAGFLGTEIPPGPAHRAGAFCDTVVERGGWKALNAMWEDTDRIPTSEELTDPEAWLLRTA